MFKPDTVIASGVAECIAVMPSLYLWIGHWVGLFWVTTVAHWQVFHFPFVYPHLPWFVWMWFRVAHEVCGRSKSGIFCVRSFTGCLFVTSCELHSAFQASAGLKLRWRLNAWVQKVLRDFKEWWRMFHPSEISIFNKHVLWSAQQPLVDKSNHGSFVVYNMCNSSWMITY